jgi:hypothetical protein
LCPRENESVPGTTVDEREKHRVELCLAQIAPHEKVLVFCANQAHALAIRDLINQRKKSSDPNYCHRVAADDGELGEQYLRDFQDNGKSPSRSAGDSPISKNISTATRWLEHGGHGDTSAGRECRKRAKP